MKTTWTLKRDRETLSIGIRKVDYIEHFPYGIYDMKHFDEKGKKKRKFVIDYSFDNPNLPYGVCFSDDRPTFKEALKCVSDSITEYIRCGYSLVM